ncbi:DMT family transporter [Streptacidiphilus monticola]
MAGGGFGIGELATLGAAVAAAAEIVLIARFAGRIDLRRITFVQLLSAGVLSFLAMPVAGEPVPGFSWVWLVAAVGLGAASAVIQLTMNWAQKSVPPMRATVIYAGEPVWGGVVGRIAGDRLPGPALLGAGLIVLGVLVSEWQPRRRAAVPTPAAGEPVSVPVPVPVPVPSPQPSPRPVVAEEEAVAPSTP